MLINYLGNITKITKNKYNNVEIIEWIKYIKIMIYCKIIWSKINIMIHNLSGNTILYSW